MNLKLAKNIIFTRTPLKSCFRFVDKFQIYPLEFPNVPEVPDICDHFPDVLEHYIDLDENQVAEEETKFKYFVNRFSETSNQTYNEKRILNLMCSLTNHVFFRYTGERYFWGVSAAALEKDNEQDLLSCEWMMPFYLYPKMKEDFKQTEFTQKKNEDIMI
jgi:hypothetical protein